MAIKSMEISRKFDVLDVGKVVSEGKRRGNLVKRESEVGFRNGYIPDWMLIEILCRLPAKYVLRYKSVSKQLLSLISDPSFVRFHVSRFREQHWTLLSSTLHVAGSGNSNFPKHMLLSAEFSDDENCPPSLSAISFPGSPEASAGKSYNVVAVSDGFVLYAQRVYLECGVTTLTNFTVYSPTTGQCVALPPPSRRFMLSTAGFVTRVEEGGSLRSFKVVRLGCCLNALEFEVFCSETGEWKDAVVRTDHEIEVAWRRTPASFNGNLHWVDRRLGIVAYDPYHAPGDRCRIIGFPAGIDQQCNNTIYNGIPSLCIGHQGRLWYFEVLVTSEDDFQFSGFCSWVLGDYDDCNSWSLYQKTKIKDISFADNLDIDVLVGFIPVPIAFHPFKADMIFLGWGDVLVSYNMKTRKLEGVDIPNGETLRNGGLKGEPCWWQTSLFLLPTWPTSIAIPSHP